MKHPYITRASRPIPRQAWKHLAIGIAAFTAAGAIALILIS